MALLACCLAAPACGDLSNEGGSAPADTDVSQSSLRGTTSSRQGVVYISFDDGSYCSGVMLGPRLIGTAGHCIAPTLPAGSKSGSSHLILSYLVSGGAEHVTSGNFSVALWPDYTSGTNAEDDFAVIWTTGDPWPFTKTIDYAYIYTDTMSAYSRYQTFGYGAYGFDGSNGGVLRTGTFELDWYGDHQFHLINRGARTCRGDSGGPSTVYLSTTTPELHVAGVVSDSYHTPSGFCAGDGTITRYSRLSAKVPWIESTTGIPCTQMKSQVTNRSVTRCFPYSLLRRTTYDCRTRTAIGSEQRIDLTTGYSNYTCGNRYQEQCVDDGTPDSYYVEHCE